MLAQLLGTKAESNSTLSDFVRNASSREKKRVYNRVIEKAIAAQNEVLERHAKNKE
ncbi:hypothetical protein [Aliidiomarina haloalkalitolerans]|uniref:hypothetical protein n=1 Tax=Aliidiomarina haloalkalitolerans TaxID=859059 RepID=UPI0018E51E3A|nr:hypothetical protein [Aliidiomarina haloalkalitolerans]